MFATSPAEAPQPAHREDYGEDRGYADREERPDKEVDAAGANHPAAGESRSSHVGERHERSKYRPEKDDDVSRPPSGQHQRSKQPDDRDRNALDVLEPSRLEAADDVVRQVKRKEEDREQRRDGQRNVLFHWTQSL